MICDSCGAEIHVGDWPFCPHGSTHGHRPFKPFEVQLSTGEIRVVDSIQAAQKVERETLQRYRNGEKISPIAFRAFNFNQDGKHYDKNAFGDIPVPRHDFHKTEGGLPIGFGSGKLEE